jgi:stress response protein YsnF
MLSQQQLTEAIGTKAYGPDGDEIGRVEHFFVDDRTGAPTWVAVTTGLFGTRHSIVPALDADFAGGSLQVPVGKEAVRSAPSPGDTQHLDPDEEARLRAHYGLDAGGRAAAGRADGDLAAPPPVQQQPVQQAPVQQAPVQQAPVQQQPVQQAPMQQAPLEQPAAPVAPAAGTGDGSMVRSEERLRVGTETTAATRVRVVKYVVTEEVQVTVPLRREEIRVEEVPLDAPDVADETLAGTGRHAAGAADRTTGSPAGGGGVPEEIVLHREEPVVSVRVVPTERVRLRTEVVQGQEQVSAQVQRERITVDEHPVAGTAVPGTDRQDIDRQDTTQALPRRDAQLRDA